jgi:hypothetical protein
MSRAKIVSTTNHLQPGRRYVDHCDDRAVGGQRPRTRSPAQ